jgi:hypothetical protein
MCRVLWLGGAGGSAWVVLVMLVALGHGDPEMSMALCLRALGSKVRSALPHLFFDSDAGSMLLWLWGRWLVLSISSVVVHFWCRGGTSRHAKSSFQQRHCGGCGE